MTKPIIAIIGRPNVGKSTLFNRLIGQRVAVVSEVSGTTRDRVVQDAQWRDKTFLLVDTGGLEPEPESILATEVRQQVETAIETADVIIFVTDIRDGVTPVDLDIVDELRQTNKPVVLAVNKADNNTLSIAAVDFYGLGIGSPIPISAHHNTGIDQVMTEALSYINATDEPDVASDELPLAIVGRTNVGKSALLNGILGEKRTIVSDIPGTTRDSIDTFMHYKDQNFLLIDTAGIRRRGRVEPGIEKYSVLRSVTAIERSEVVLLVLDASDLVTAQDLHIAGQIVDSYKGVVVVINKWDLAPEIGLDQADVLTLLRERFRFMPYAPIRFVSATEGTNITDTLDAAKLVYNERFQWVQPAQLRAAVWDAMAAHQPPSQGKRSLRLQRVRQEAVAPPTISFYVNDPKLLHFSYKRYLENRLRHALGFRWTHLKLLFKGGKEL